MSPQDKMERYNREIHHFEQERIDQRKHCLMRCMSSVLSSMAVGFPDAEGIALRRVMKLEKLLDEQLALGK